MGRTLAEKFKIPIRASIGSRIIANGSISVIRKDVLAKGKKRMKAMGRVEVPQEAFMAVLKLNQ